MRVKIDTQKSLEDIPKYYKQAPSKPLKWFSQHYADEKIAMAEAYLSGHYTLKEVGLYFDTSYATVSRAVKNLESK